MASTQTMTGKNPISQAAGLFLSATGDDSQKGEPGNDVFVLNSEAFVKLQTYLNAGIKCAASKNMFESEYPRRAFAQYFSVDDTLYDGLRDQIVLIHEHCEGFQGKVVGPMVTTGGLVGDFGNFTQGEIQTILKHLETLLDPNVGAKDEKFATAKGRVRVACRKIASRADNIRKTCDDLVEDLQAFRSQTESDKIAMTKLQERFKKVMPTKEQQDSALKRLLDSIRSLVEALKNEAVEAMRQFRKAGKVRWYHWIPIIGLAIYIYDVIKQKGLLKMIKDVTEKLRVAKQQGEADKVSMARAHTLVNALGGQVDVILEVIDGAINAVGEMTTGFSTLSTNFTSVRAYLQDVEGDIDEDTLVERGLAKEDLKLAQDIWIKVAKLGKDFQQHGRMLESDSEKGVPDTRQFSFPVDDEEKALLLSF